MMRLSLLTFVGFAAGSGLGAFQGLEAFAGLGDANDLQKHLEQLQQHLKPELMEQIQKVVTQKDFMGKVTNMFDQVKDEFKTDGDHVAHMTEMFKTFSQEPQMAQLSELMKKPMEDMQHIMEDFAALLKEHPVENLMEELNKECPVESAKDCSEQKTSQLKKYLSLIVSKIVKDEETKAKAEEFIENLSEQVVTMFQEYLPKMKSMQKQVVESCGTNPKNADCVMKALQEFVPMKEFMAAFKSNEVSELFKGAVARAGDVKKVVTEQEIARQNEEDVVTKVIKPRKARGLREPLTKPAKTVSV